MNSDTQNTPGEFTDAAVFAEYRAVAPEASPPRLDRKILREAAQEANSTGKFAWGGGWLRPLTFVATMGLSIALMMELYEYQVFDPPADMETDAVTDTRASIEETAADSAQPGPAAASQAEPIPRKRDRVDSIAFRDAVDVAAEQVRAIDASASATLRDMPKSESASKSAIPAPAAMAQETALERPQCTEVQRANADEWWLCINAFRSAGLQDEAEIELQKMQEVFPQFSPQ